MPDGWDDKCVLVLGLLTNPISEWGKVLVYV